MTISFEEKLQRMKIFIHDYRKLEKKFTKICIVCCID